MNAVTPVFSRKVCAIHQLRINVKSLAAEARMIRQETKRCGIPYRDMLAFHRRGKLRQEARYTQLALAFIRERAYKQVEFKAAEKVDSSRLTGKICKFFKTNETEVKKWLNT